MSWLDYVFGPTGHISWPQECARSVLVFVYGLALLRVAGRRLFGKWAALDVVVSIIIGSSLSRAATGNADLFGTLLATALMVFMYWLTAQGAARWRSFAHLVEGADVQLAVDGEVRPDALKRHAISAADLAEALRQAGVERLSETRLLSLEPSGKITVLKAS